MSVCMLQASRVALKQSDTRDQQPAPQHPAVALLAEPSGPIPQGHTPFVVASPMFPPGLNHPGAIPLGYYPTSQIPFLFPPLRICMSLSWLR